MQDACSAVGLCKLNPEVKGCRMHVVQRDAGCMWCRWALQIEPRAKGMQDAEGCKMHAMQLGSAN